MSAVDLTAGTVMNGVAALLNDSARQVYTYSAQVPYLNLALQELRESYELNSVPVTEDVSSVINMPVGSSKIVYNGVGIPTLPNDFVEPKQVWERQENIDPWVSMTRRQFLPHYLEGILYSQFLYYVWQSQEIRVLPCNQDNDIKIDYVKQLFDPVVNETSLINVVNAVTFLQFRTAGLCAEFIERNITSANAQNAMAQLAHDRALGISAKGKQSIVIRRRPFRASYNRGGFLS